MVSAAPPDARFVSFEIDADRAAAAQETLAGHRNVEIVQGDASELFERGPFDLLVLDGGPGAGKVPGDNPVEPEAVLRPGGTLVVDDFSPTRTWPPRFDGAPDDVRLHWLEHPDLRSTEIQVAEDLAVVISRYWPGEPG
jgi:predicted O-methyltransferase YrrM